MSRIRISLPSLDRMALSPGRKISASTARAFPSWLRGIPSPTRGRSPLKVNGNATKIRPTKLRLKDNVFFENNNNNSRAVPPRPSASDLKNRSGTPPTDDRKVTNPPRFISPSTHCVSTVTVSQKRKLNKFGMTGPVVARTESDLE